MRKHELAKVLLSRFTTEERASAIVGDLMEDGGSDFRFWYAVAVTAAAFSTRPAAGILAAMGAEVVMRWAYLWSWKAANPISGVTGFFAVWMLLLTMIAAYSALQRGLSDALTKAAGVLWLLASAGVFLRLIAWVPAVSGASATLVILVLLNQPQGRKALLAILSAAAAAFGAMYASWWLLFANGNGVQHSVYINAGSLFILPAISVAAALSWRPREASARPV